MGRPAVFFDRDGIIVQPIHGEAPTAPEEMELISEIIPVLQKSKQSGYLIFVVSNQPDVALGIVNEETKNNLEAKFEKLLENDDIVFDRIYYCHHASGCDCRKPKPGLLLQAKKEFDVDMEKSFMIGDRASDIKAGISAGTKTILFDPKNLQKSYLKEHDVKPDIEINELRQILQII